MEFGPAGAASLRGGAAGACCGPYSNGDAAVREPPMSDTVEEINRRARAGRDRLDPFFREVEKALVGQHHLIHRLIVGLLTDGHILLEGRPGLAKPLAVRPAPRGLQLDLRRSQCT